MSVSQTGFTVSRRPGASPLILRGLDPALGRVEVGVSIRSVSYFYFVNTLGRAVVFVASGVVTSYKSVAIPLSVALVHSVHQILLLNRVILLT